MCGRYTLATPEGELIEAFDLPGLTFDYFARYNIAPGQAAPVVAEDRRGRRAGLMTWGLVPPMAVGRSSGFINARAESVATKPSFREAVRRRRCLVPADGFYEWQQRDEGPKAPHWLHPATPGPIAFAGIWEPRDVKGGRASFSILTRRANEDVAPIHDRMPVVVAPDRWNEWLSRETAWSAVTGLLAVTPDVRFVARPVSTRVNSVREDDEELLAAVG